MKIKLLWKARSGRAVWKFGYQAKSHEYKIAFIGMKAWMKDQILEALSGDSLIS